MTDIARRRLEGEAARLSKKYGQKAGALGSEHFKLDVIATGSLALDYTLGTGGWARGRINHVYGEPDVGKSSTLGLAAFANAQAMGLTTGLIAVEPGFDPIWATKHGVDPDLLVVARPNNGEEAFNILYDWLTGDIVDFVVFDSIGGVVTPSEDQQEGKARVGGASALITSGLRRIINPVWRNNKGLILLNQIREDMNSRYPGQVKPPGGKLLTHAADVWVHLRQSSGADSVKKIKIDGEDVIVGRRLTAHVTRNKMCEGTGHKAKFWYHNMGTEQYGPVGIDATADIIATGMRTGVISRAGAYYRHESFPDKHQILGIDGVDAFLAENPKIVGQIRHQVLDIMMAKAKKPIDHEIAPNLDDEEAA